MVCIFNLKIGVQSLVTLEINEALKHKKNCKEKDLENFNALTWECCIG